MRTPLTDAERLDWLRLIRSENVGPRTFHALIERFGSAVEALAALPVLARRGGRLVYRVASREEAEREMEAALRLGARLLARGEAGYPAALAAIDTAPPLLTVRGRADALAGPMVAVVGSRNASAAGLTFTERLARGLGQAGLTVVSGLARGIDTRAHRSSLGTGTVAVLAGGQASIYPAENIPLAEAIVDQGGALVSEMPLGWEARSRDFPRRNRLVSGLSLGLVVVEAARRSGSLITARLALEQGREVFAVPGSPLDPRAEGTNDLIRSGATLCASPEHVTEVLAPLIEGGHAVAVRDGARGLQAMPFSLPWDEEEGEPASSPEGDEGDESRRVINLLSTAPIATDDLARQARVPVRMVRMILLELELAGRLQRHGADAVSLTGGP